MFLRVSFDSLTQWLESVSDEINAWNRYYNIRKIDGWLDDGISRACFVSYFIGVKEIFKPGNDRMKVLKECGVNK